ncbi:E3 ubiquitin-protein ligase ARIH2-like isoform X2 [Patiria miniata]|nr:E3 ubiquitin-protein ligase ARIH2-like isoform X2 [Patiria miniata]XP_038054027.1 E3 ubiquitin-protein ligase ARIH2-like isoform X2 [Patiria miniata]XP_038054028.1 E3 ubiquitin-protein ligase ARIH2-like isoform X2 [Patiria miniata]
MSHRWNLDAIQSRTKQDIANLLAECGVLPSADSSLTKEPATPSNYVCPVCIEHQSKEQVRSLLCGHFFCKDCWTQHLVVLINEGTSTGIHCMAEKCLMRAPEDFVLPLLQSEQPRLRYNDFYFKESVKNHSNLRFCPGADCTIVVYAEEVKSKRAECTQCKTNWCFNCCNNYHAPADCDIIKRWLTKCADDSETANYISAHTKDCPVCNICIEKNGGCNHMQCSKCLHNFCWMCLGDWKTHGSEYYECSRYKENPNIANESANVKAREALKKYLFYYERWDNHAKSLRLEQETLRKSQERIQEKVENKMGTWIDWQYLLAAASLLAKCRYTLQYTYPFAYYLEPSPRKKLFEYQQAQLEAEIENLSWKVERAATYDRGDLENQMNVAEKRRQTMLKDFFPA